jgi:hypothetical protein
VPENKNGAGAVAVVVFSVTGIDFAVRGFRSFIQAARNCMIRFRVLGSWSLTGCDLEKRENMFNATADRKVLLKNIF